ncbi:MAG: efflux RND transporter periplasmic adaptor subunit [Phycisphaerae bacterium]|nr:efflux RND transporter periplasmic adaptor subunit [Phycisphaerae bacterium]
MLAKAKTMDFQQALILQGNVQAVRVATVSPRMPGVLDEIFVDEGDKVVAGQTRLFQTDAMKLTKAVEIAKHQVTIAESSLRERKAFQKREQADHDQAVINLNRYKVLREKRVATAYEYDTAETKFKSTAAMLEHAKALVALAEARLKGIRSSLQIAKKDLGDSLVKAPISGYVCYRLREPGEMGAPGIPVLRIEDISTLEVSAFLPAKAYGLIHEGKTRVQVKVNGTDLGERDISYKSPTIHPKLRTFEIKCLVKNPPASVAPGAMAKVCIILRRQKGLGVPNDAIQHRGGRTVVFTVNNNQANMIPVTTGMETNGATEVASEKLKENTDVIVMGGFLVKDKSSVRVLREKK